MLKVFIGQSVLGRSDTTSFIEQQIAELDMSNKLEICLHPSLDSYALINFFFSSLQCALCFLKRQCIQSTGLIIKKRPCVKSLITRTENLLIWRKKYELRFLLRKVPYWNIKQGCVEVGRNTQIVLLTTEREQAEKRERWEEIKKNEWWV